MHHENISTCSFCYANKKINNEYHALNTFAKYDGVKCVYVN